MNELQDRSRGFIDLLRDLVVSSADLLRNEVRLGRMEMTSIAASVARGSAAVALGSVLILLGALALATGLVLLAGDQWLPKDRYWLAALLIMAITGALAAWFARKGMAHLSPASLAPDQTFETLKEDKEWLKRRLTSGATSS